MKKRGLLFAAAFFTAFFLAACGSGVFTVKFNTDGGTVIKEISFTEALLIEEEPFTEKEGYIFEGWYEEPGFSGNKIDFPFTFSESSTIYAKWSEDKGGEDSDPGGGDNDGKPADPTEPTEPTEPAIPEVFKIIFVTGSGASVEPVEKEEGLFIDGMPETVLSGYIFDGWYTEEGGKGERVNFPFKVTEDKTFYAYFYECPFLNKTYEYSFQGQDGYFVADTVSFEEEYLYYYLYEDWDEYKFAYEISYDRVNEILSLSCYDSEKNVRKTFTYDITSDSVYNESGNCFVKLE